MAVRAIKAPGLWTSDVLAKPLDEGALLAAIDQAVARSHLCPGTAEAQRPESHAPADPAAEGSAPGAPRAR